MKKSKALWSNDPGRTLRASEAQAVWCHRRPNRIAIARKDPGASLLRAGLPPSRRSGRRGKHTHRCKRAHQTVERRCVHPHGSRDLTRRFLGPSTSCSATFSSAAAASAWVTNLPAARCMSMAGGGRLLFIVSWIFGSIYVQRAILYACACTRSRNFVTET
jgi:hypothetical protein